MIKVKVTQPKDFSMTLTMDEHSAKILYAIVKTLTYDVELIMEEVKCNTEEICEVIDDLKNNLSILEVN